MRKRPLSVVAAAGIWAVAMMPATARAQNAAASQDAIAELKQQVRALEAKIEKLESMNQKVQIIDRKLELDEQAQKDRQFSMPAVQANAEGFYLKDPEDRYKLHIGGWVQADSRWFTSQEPAPQSSTFVMRRVRPYFEGTLAKYYDFRLLLDFGQGTATLQDAWADMHYWDEFRLRMGKMKAPTGIERRQDDRYLTFVERALTVNMVPDRDIGGMIHGIFWNKSLEWQLFMGNSVPDNTAAFDLANNDGKDYMGMLFWRPFQAFGGSENTKGFGLGLMGSYGTTRGNVLDTFKSTAQATIFTYNSGVYAVGGRYRIVPQASYYNGPFSLYGEWVENWQEIGRNVTVAGQPQSLTDGISDQSWQISAAYVLTGEDASYTGVKPRHDFNPFIGDWGAFEVAARMDQLLVDRSAFDLGYADPTKSVRQATEWAIGFNWYLNRNVKFMVDYARTSFTLGASGGHNRPKESANLTELQLAY